MATLKDSYNVETREDLRGGADYSENHQAFETPEEVQAYINSLHEDERVYSIELYRDGSTSNPVDVTHRFKRQFKKQKNSRIRTGRIINRY